MKNPLPFKEMKALRLAVESQKQWNVSQVEEIHWPDLSSHWFETRLIDQDTHTVAYELGYLAPNYPMPAMADTNTVIHLFQLEPKTRRAAAWDFIWREDVTDIPFVMFD